MEKIKVAIITLSDKGSSGLREDLSMPAIKEVLGNYDCFEVVKTSILPDDFMKIYCALDECVEEEINLVLTTGGTGFSVRDVTPEATRKVIEKEAPGIAEAMRYSSMKYTNRAMLSRGVCGIKNLTVILNLPGSPKACKENLEVVIEPLIHAIETLLGSVSECAR